MKKKTIEKIPFLTAEKIPQKQYKYIAVAAVKKVSSEDHLFVEIYANNKKTLKIPVYRLVYTKNDWGNFLTETGIWSSCSVADEYGTTIWNDEWGYEKKSDTYISDEHVRVISKYVGGKGTEKYWWRYLERMEEEIKAKRWEKRAESRGRRLEERCSNVPELPEDFEEWYKTSLFGKINYIYYKRKGRYAQFWCSKCGRSYSYPVERKDSFEGQFERIIETPYRNLPATCELCGAKGQYKTAGTMKDVYEVTKKCYVGQAYKETGAIIRYFHIKKILEVGKAERFIVIELARNFYDGNKVITDYHLHDLYIGRDRWCDHNVGYMGGNIIQKPGTIHEGMFELLKGTALQYSGIKEFAKYYDEVPVAGYMTTYNQKPYIEMLSKMGMYHIVRNLIESPWDVKLQENATTPNELLRINKSKMNELKRRHGDMDYLKIFQMEKEMGMNWTMEQCERLMDIVPKIEDAKTALRYMTVQQLLNRVEKYAGIPEGASCKMTFGQLRYTAGIYLDYLKMRCQRGYDLNNTIFQFPRNLEEAHENMVKEINEHELDARMEEVKQKYPEIRRSYRKQREKYYYEDERMVIRPARSAEEIVVEGMVLHHCVGGDGYLRKHNDGESIILMLRFKEKEKLPYITIEITGTRIVQWYGAYNKKPDEANIEKWLKQYINQLKEKTYQMMQTVTDSHELSAAV